MKNQQMRVNSIIVNKGLLFSEYVYWYLMYSFFIAGILLLIFPSYSSILYILLGVFFLILVDVIIRRFIKVKEDEYILELSQKKIILLKNGNEIKEINNIQEVDFILSGYKGEPIIFSFSNKSGYNKLEVKRQNGNIMYFLFRLNSRKEYEEFVRYMKTASFSYKTKIKKQFFS